MFNACAEFQALTAASSQVQMRTSLRNLHVARYRLIGIDVSLVLRASNHSVQLRYSLLATELMSIISSGLQTWVGQKDPGVKAPTRLRRSLQYLHAMIKELASMKMLGGIKATGQVS
jgi:hypothetical protein